MATFTYQEKPNLTEAEFNNGLTYYTFNGSIYTKAETYIAGQVYYVKIGFVGQVYLEDQNGDYSLVSFASKESASPQWEEISK